MKIPGKALFFLLFLAVPAISFSQHIILNLDAEPLNEVLIRLSISYGIQISFDDRNLSQYEITMDKSFETAESALNELLTGLPLELKQRGDVFVIIQQKKSFIPKSFCIKGQVLEKGTMEPLPYANIQVNGTGMAADLKGSFTFISISDSIFNVRVSHLGYYIKDTVVRSSEHLNFMLTPSIIGLTEVVIKNSLVEKSTLAGREAGMMKLNHLVASFLPGFGDNSVFNLLRLQPGILAAGEQTNELIIWGCYEGQSKVIFDGFTIYGLKNFNDNISAFNPLMAKDIEVFKGGYDARFGERVGGIVNITGKNGNTENTSFSVNLNNMTLNGMIEVPIARSGSLVIALRHTYYELYNPGDISSILGKRRGKDSTNSVDVTVVPDYRFRDMNIKYSAKIKERDFFYISLYGGNDRFSYDIEEPVDNLSITKNTEERNTQSGGTIFYGTNWNNGYSTNFSLNYSVLKSKYSDYLLVERTNQQIIKEYKDLKAENHIRENSVQVDNRFPVHPAHTLEGGMIFLSNRIELAEDTFNIVQASIRDTARRITLFFQDNMTIKKIIQVKAGIRLTQALYLGKFYPEPRISLSITAGTAFKINAAWGKYNQYVTKSSTLDDLGNYRYIWTICDDEQIPVLGSYHYVLGTSYYKNDLTISVEGYYKDVSGLTRYVRNTSINLEGIYKGIGRSYGVDFLLKKDYKWLSAWLSYSIGKSEELFEYFKKEEYRRSPQDQRHEVKVAALANLDPFFISADYVFGSGFPLGPGILAESEADLTYSRLDVSFIYKFLNRRVKGEVGLSVLNVMNTQNIKYANFERVLNTQTNSVNIYSEAIPITPALYLKIAM